MARERIQTNYDGNAGACGRLLLLLLLLLRRGLLCCCCCRACSERRKMSWLTVYMKRSQYKYIFFRPSKLSSPSQ